MGIRILIIEDEADLADFIVRGLREEGFAVERAGDGERAWEALEMGAWDLVMLAWWLPGGGRPVGSPPLPAGGRSRAGALPDGAGLSRRPGPGTRLGGGRLPHQA